MPAKRKRVKGYTRGPVKRHSVGSYLRKAPKRRKRRKSR